MKNLTQQDIKVLHLLNRHSEGLSLSAVQNGASFERKEYALSNIKKLIRKGWIIKKDHLYFLVGDIKNISPVGSAIHITPTTTKPQRPHAILASAIIYRTSQGRAAATLEAMGIPYKIGGTGELNFTWRSYSFKITSKRLITYPDLPELPLNLPLQAIKEKAAAEAGLVIEAFLGATGLRCVRNGLGRLAIEIRYWENGYPQNEIAEESLKEGESRIVYAYDKELGRPSVWSDSSLNPFKELETNSARFDKEIKEWMQATDNGEIHPYEDELKARQHITELYNLMAEAQTEIEGLKEGYKVEVQFAAKHNLLIEVLVRKEMARLPKKEREGFERRLAKLNEPGQRKLMRQRKVGP